MATPNVFLFFVISLLLIRVDSAYASEYEELKEKIEKERIALVKVKNKRMPHTGREPREAWALHKPLFHRAAKLAVVLLWGEFLKIQGFVSM